MGNSYCVLRRNSFKGLCSNLSHQKTIFFVSFKLCQIFCNNTFARILLLCKAPLFDLQVLSNFRLSSSTTKTKPNPTKPQKLPTMLVQILICRFSYLSSDPSISSQPPFMLKTLPFCPYAFNITNTLL